MLHTFPFLINDLTIALDIAYGVVAVELIANRLHSISLYEWQSLDDGSAGDRRSFVEFTSADVTVRRER
jgi:hypothetical protein